MEPKKTADRILAEARERRERTTVNRDSKTLLKLDEFVTLLQVGGIFFPALGRQDSGYFVHNLSYEGELFVIVTEQPPSYFQPYRKTPL